MQNSASQLLGLDLPLRPVDPALLTEAKQHLDALTKPKGSLGRLEELAARLYAIYGGRTPLAVDPAILFTVAADHGIAKHGVSAYPQAVTRQMVTNFLQGGGAINIICRETGMTLCLVDAGCVGGPFPVVANPSLLERRLGDGTADMSEEKSMSRDTAIKGIVQGIELVRDAAAEGCQCTAIGEMGIGNTSAATAIFSALLALDPMSITGPGTGLTDEERLAKAALIQKALSLHAATLAHGDAIDVLACVGGFEIATMTGIVLGSAAESLPVLIDGFIATAAYALAVNIDPCVRDYAFLTHTSAEPGHTRVLAALSVDPLLNLGLRLGEGTGAAMSYPLFRAAAAIYNDMATFQKAGVAHKTHEQD